jgi:hypothetical protein
MNRQEKRKLIIAYLDNCDRADTTMEQIPTTELEREFREAQRALVNYREPT